MSNQAHIQDELRSFDSNLPFNNSQPFLVPEGYFEGLAASVLAKIKSSEASVQKELEGLSPLLAGISKTMPYSVPLFYFEQNSEALPDLHEPDLSFLNGIGKQLPYQVPQGYFENLADEITSKVAPVTAKVVPMFARKWMRMAAAAVIGGFVAISGYQYFAGTAPTVSAQPDSTQMQVAYTPSVIEKEIKKVSTKDIENFIETVDVTPKKKEAETKNIAAKAEVKNLVKDVSDSDMESFLSQLPAADEDLGATN